MAQPDAVRNAVGQLSADKRAAWRTLLNDHAQELNSEGQSVMAFCETVRKLDGLDDPSAARWLQLRGSCARLASDEATRQGQADRQGQLQRELAEVTAQKKEWAESDRGAQRTAFYSGFIIARLNDHRYEVAQARSVYQPDLPCLGGPSECNREAFRQMAAPAEAPSETHDILETVTTTFETKGKFSLRVRLKGSERATDRSGFAHNVDVYEEVEEETPAKRNERAAKLKDLNAREKAARDSLAQPADPLTASRVARDTDQVERLLACLAKTTAACSDLNAPLPGAEGSTPDITRFVTSAFASKRADVIARHLRAGAACEANKTTGDGRATFTCESCPTFGGIECGSAFAGDPINLIVLIYQGYGTFEKVKQATTIDGDWQCGIVNNVDSCWGRVRGSQANNSDEMLSIVIARLDRGAMVTVQLASDPHGG